LELERDELCMLFEGMTGVLRFRLTARRRVEGVLLRLENPLTGAELKGRKIPVVENGETKETAVSLRGQEAGGAVWYVKVDYEAAGRARSLEGELTVFTSKPQEAQKAAEHLSVTINNNISNGNASDVTISQHAVDDLAQLAKADNPYEKLRSIVQGTKRAWTLTSLDRAGPLEPLPPMPEAAAADRLRLELGRVRLHLRAGWRVTLGRSRECDITFRSWAGWERPEDPEDDPFNWVSRRHCQFEPWGNGVAVWDGTRGEMMSVHPSSQGTYWNNTRLEGTKVLESGQEAVLSFGAAETHGGMGVAAKACPTGGGCGACTRTDRRWCADGKHSSLLLTRRKGPKEAYATLWSCFPLGAVDPAFEGVTLFREGEGFAWRRGKRCGWLVPGTTIQTECGPVWVEEEPLRPYERKAEG
jgi:hypothetical protein